MNEIDPKKEGWNWLVNATKWHYFREGRSLCGRWMVFRYPANGFAQGNDDSVDNCKACSRKIIKEKA